jgi:tetratricopeptide (TPR) repeat protein
MQPLTVTFHLADSIAKGLTDGTLERVGGIIRHVSTKQIVVWLREIPSHAVSLGDPFTGSLNLLVSGAKTLATIEGFADVKEQISGVSQQIMSVQQGLQQTQSILQITSAASIMNLGVSVMSFAVITHRLNEMEKRLKKAEALLSKINRKIDLGFYANFHAAVKLAINAFSMNKAENRISSAHQAINRFLEAEKIYQDLTEKELDLQSQIANEYLLTLALAYLAEVRCHLELEEYPTALQRFQEGSQVLKELIQRYVDLLLTSNPAIYLSPQFKGQIDLQRLTKIYQWANPNLDENAVFEMQRDNFSELIKDPDKWVKSLPQAIVSKEEVQGWMLVGPSNDDIKKEACKRLPQVLEVVESMIETDRRFESYQAEVKAIQNFGISFHEWMRLEPPDPQPEQATFMYIIPFDPLVID